jgi:demethylmenaquinone methyltransferase/2-methoxy-6-polyprenyl-1,4-benzoquinol methylase
LTLTHHRIDFFEKIAPTYDFFLDLLTFGLYAKFLKRAIEILAPKKGKKILDLCSGTGRVASWMAQAVGTEGEVIGMDVSKNMVEVARKRYGTLTNVIFLQKDVTEPWAYQNYFDGIFVSFSLHEISESERPRVIEQSYLALKEKGRMVIADFNPEISGRSKTLLLIFFKLFERKNLSFLSFGQKEILMKVGFKRIKIFRALAGILQISLALKE